MQASTLAVEKQDTRWNLPRVTIKASDAPMDIFIQQVAKLINVSVSVPDEAKDRTITASYDTIKARTVLEEIASKLDLRVEYESGVIRFVTQDQQTNTFTVLRSNYVPPLRLSEVLRAQLGEKVTVELLDDRVIVSGTREQVELANRIAKYTESGADGWMLEVKIVTLNDNIKQELGVDWQLGATINLSASEAQSVLASSAFVEAILKATRTGTDAKLLDTANLYVLEGTQSTLNRGQSIPIPKFTTTVQGSTSVSGYEYIDTGFILSVAATRVPEGIRLTMEPTLSTVTGFVRDAPITQRSSITADVIVHNGDWIVLSGLETIKQTDATTNIPGLPKTIFEKKMQEVGAESILILVKATRVHRSQL